MQYIERALQLTDMAINGLEANHVMKCAYILGHLRALLESIPVDDHASEPLSAISATPEPVSEVQGLEGITPDTIEHATALLADIDLSDVDRVKQLLSSIKTRVSGAYRRVSDGVKNQFYKWRAFPICPEAGYSG